MSNKNSQAPQAPTQQQKKDTAQPAKSYVPFNGYKEETDWGQHRHDCDFLIPDAEKQQFRR
jgi:hypothetical protein